MTGKKSKIEVAPHVLTAIDEADRTTWNEVDYIMAGQQVSAVKFHSQLILGILVYEYSQMWGDCTRYARQAHIDANSLLAYRRVYKKIHEQDPDYVPDGYIPWGVLQIAADTKDPIGMIEDLSVNDKVSIAEAHRYRKERETGKTVPTKPKVSLKWSEEAGLWQIDISEEDFEKIDWALVGKQLGEYLKKLWEK